MKDVFRFHVFKLKKDMGLTMGEIMELEVSEGVIFINMLFDLQMQAEIKELSINGIDPKDVGKCGTDIYANWMRSKTSVEEVKPLELSENEARVQCERFEAEIARTMGKELLIEKVENGRKNTT